MTALSSYAERKILDHLFKNTSYTSPNAYVGAFTSDPTDSASGTECSGSGYARVRIDDKMSSSTTGADTSSITNSSAIDVSASFSPDGKKIVFNSDRSGRRHLYIASINGKDTKKI